MGLSAQIYKMMLDQYHMELTNQYRYSAMAGWARYRGYEAAAHWFNSEAHSEGKHAKFVRKLIEDRGMEFNPMPVNVVESVNYQTYSELFRKALQVEQDTTASINAIYGQALRENDYLVCQSLKPIFDIQYDEEKEYLTIVDKIISRGGDPNGSTDKAFTVFDTDPCAIHDFEIWLDKHYN